MSRRRSKAPRSNAGLLVKSPATVRKALNSRIRQAFSSNKILFVAAGSHDPGDILLDDLQVRVPCQLGACVPLIRDLLVWLGVRVYLVQDGQDIFISQTEMHAYRGPASSAEKSLLLRADWVLSDWNNSGDHPQPHWHIHPHLTGAISIPTFEDLVNELPPHFELDLDERTERIAESSDTRYRAHLAMWNKWHEGRTDCQLWPENARDISGWIAGCARHLREQLAHALQR